MSGFDGWGTLPNFNNDQMCFIIGYDVIYKAENCALQGNLAWVIISLSAHLMIFFYKIDKTKSAQKRLIFQNTYISVRKI